MVEPKEDRLVGSMTLPSNTAAARVEFCRGSAGSRRGRGIGALRSCPRMEHCILHRLAEDRRRPEEGGVVWVSEGWCPDGLVG